MSWFNNNRSRSALCFRIWVKTSRFDPSFFRNHLWRHCWATKRWFDDGWTWTPATGGISGLQVKWNSSSSSSVFVCDYWTIRAIVSNRAVNSPDVFFQSQRPVHHGRTGLQFPVHNGRPGLHHPGPLQRTQHSQTQPLPVALHRRHQRPPQLLHGQSLHAHEAAVRNAFPLK